MTRALAFVIAVVATGGSLDDTEAGAVPVRDTVATKPGTDSRPLKTFAIVAGPEVRMTSATAPSLILGPGAFAGITRLGPDGSTLWALQLSGFYGRSSNLESNLGNARITRWNASLDACAFGLGTKIALTPCAFLQVGQLEGSGLETVDPEVQKALWLAPGAALNLSASLGRHFLVAADVGAFVTLVRPRFFFASGALDAPEETVYEVPALGVTGAMRFGARLP